MDPPSLYDKLHAQLDVVLKCEQPLDKRVESLMTGWTELANNCRAFPADQVVPIALCFRDQTLTIILCGKWTTNIRAQYEDKLETSIQRCGEELISVAPKLSNHIGQLLRVLNDPWGNPILGRILANPDTVIKDEEYEFFMRESPYMILTRLKQLYNDRCEDMALNLVTALMECCDLAQALPIENQFTMTIDQKLFTFDVYITLLVKSGRADVVGRELQGMSYDQGCDLVKRFTRKRADVSRLWRNAGQIALLAAAIFTSKAVLIPYEQCKDSLAELLTVWLQHSDYYDGLEKLQLSWHRLIPGSVSSQHVYSFCDAITPLFSDKLRYFKLELLVKAISTDINMLERLKTQSTWNTEVMDDRASNMVQEPDPEMSLLPQEEIEARIQLTTERIAAAFVRMADWVPRSPQLLRESLLTAFSVFPTADVLVRMEESARALGNHVIPSAGWRCSAHPPQSECDQDLKDLDLLFVCSSCLEDFQPINYTQMLKLASKHSYNIYEVVEAENPGISPDVKDDVIVLLFAARFQPLTWNQSWPELQRLCSMFLRDTTSVKSLIKDLDYANIDFGKLFEKKKQNVERERIERRAQLERQDEALLQSLFHGDNSDDDWDEGPHRKKRKRIKPRKLRDSSSEDEDESIKPISSAPCGVMNVPSMLTALKNNPPPHHSTKLLRTFRRNNHKPVATTSGQPSDASVDVSLPFRDTFSVILGDDVANGINAVDTTGVLNPANTISKNGSHRSLNKFVRRTTTCSFDANLYNQAMQRMLIPSQTKQIEKIAEWSYAHGNKSSKSLLNYFPDVPDELVDVYGLLNQKIIVFPVLTDNNGDENNVSNISLEEESVYSSDDSEIFPSIPIQPCDLILTEEQKIEALANAAREFKRLLGDEEKAPPANVQLKSEMAKSTASSSVVTPDSIPLVGGAFAPNYESYQADKAINKQLEDSNNNTSSDNSSSRSCFLTVSEKELSTDASEPKQTVHNQSEWNKEQHGERATEISRIGILAGASTSKNSSVINDRSTHKKFHGVKKGNNNKKKKRDDRERKLLENLSLFSTLSDSEIPILQKLKAEMKRLEQYYKREDTKIISDTVPEPDIPAAELNAYVTIISGESSSEASKSSDSSKVDHNQLPDVIEIKDQQGDSAVAKVQLGKRRTAEVLKEILTHDSCDLSTGIHIHSQEEKNRLLNILEILSSTSILSDSDENFIREMKEQIEQLDIYHKRNSAAVTTQELDTSTETSSDESKSHDSSKVVDHKFGNVVETKDQQSSDDLSLLECTTNQSETDKHQEGLAADSLKIETKILPKINGKEDKPGTKNPNEEEKCDLDLHLISSSDELSSHERYIDSPESDKQHHNELVDSHKTESKILPEARETKDQRGEPVTPTRNETVEEITNQPDDSTKEILQIPLIDRAGPSSKKCDIQCKVHEQQIAVSNSIGTCIGFSKSLPIYPPIVKVDRIPLEAVRTIFERMGQRGISIGVPGDDNDGEPVPKKRREDHENNGNHSGSSTDDDVITISSSEDEMKLRPAPKQTYPLHAGLDVRNPMDRRIFLKKLLSRAHRFFSPLSEVNLNRNYQVYVVQLVGAHRTGAPAAPTAPAAAGGSNSPQTPQFTQQQQQQTSTQVTPHIQRVGQPRATMPTSTCGAKPPSPNPSPSTTMGAVRSTTITDGTAGGAATKTGAGPGNGDIGDAGFGLGGPRGSADAGAAVGSDVDSQQRVLSVTQRSITATGTTISSTNRNKTQQRINRLSPVTSISVDSGLVNANAPATTQSTLINILSQQTVRPANVLTTSTVPTLSQNHSIATIVTTASTQRPRTAPLINIISSQQIVKPTVTSSKTTPTTITNNTSTATSDQIPVINHLFRGSATTTTNTATIAASTVANTLNCNNTPVIKTVLATPTGETTAAGNRVMQIICKSADGRLIPVTSLANRVLKVTSGAAIDLHPTQASTDNNSTVSACTNSILPKFNQVFGKTVYQSTSASIPTGTGGTVTAVTTTNKQHMPQPLTIKSAMTTVNRANVQPLQVQGIQGLQGGVIYTRQMPVGIGQTINIIGGTPQARQVFRIAATAATGNSTAGEHHHLSLVKDTVIHSKMSALLAAALQGQKATTTNSTAPIIINHEQSAYVTASTIATATTTTTAAPNENSSTGTILTPGKIHIRPTTLVQAMQAGAANVSLSSTTLEQLREFDMVYKQVTERSGTSTPADLVVTASSEAVSASGSDQAVSTTSTTATTTVLATQPQRISLAYVNNQGINKLNCAQLPLVVVSSYGNAGICGVSGTATGPTKLVTAKVTKVSTAAPSVPAAGTRLPTKITPPSTPALSQEPLSSPSQQSSSQSSPQASSASVLSNGGTSASKTSPIPKPPAKPQEDEHTTQRIFDILAEYAEQLRNSPDLNNKPAPRRRSNPPTNPTTGSSSGGSSKRKKSGNGASGGAVGSSNGVGANKKASASTASSVGSTTVSVSNNCAGQQSSSSSTDVEMDDGRTMGSEDSSGCGGPTVLVSSPSPTIAASPAVTVQETIGGASTVPVAGAHITVATTPQQSPPQQLPTPARPLQATTHQQHLIITDPTTNQTRNLIISDGSVTGMANATAVLVPGNYLMPLTSVVKSGQQIAVVNAGGNKILATVPAGRNIQHPNMLLFQSFLNQLPTATSRKSTPAAVVATTAASSTTTANSNVPTTTTVKYSLQTGQPVVLQSTPITATDTSPARELLFRIAAPVRNSTRTTVTTVTAQHNDDALMETRAIDTDDGDAASGTNETTNTPIVPIATSVIQAQTIQSVQAKDASTFTTANVANRHISGKVVTPVVNQGTSGVVRGVLSSVGVGGRITSVVVNPSSNPAPVIITAPAQAQSIASPPVSSAPFTAVSVSVIEQTASQTPILTKDQPAHVLLRNGGTAKRTQVQATVPSCPATLALNSKPLPYYTSSSNLLKFRKLMTNAALKAEQQAPLQTLPLLQRRHAAAAAAVYERELRIQKSLSEECEDLGVDEPSASDLFPEAADLLVFDNNHSPTATSFDNLQIHHSTVSSSSATDSHVVKHSHNVDNDREEKLTLFGDDDFLFDSDEYQTSQSQLPQLPSFEEDMGRGGVVTTAIVNGSDHTLLQTCTSMSDVTMNSPISPEYPGGLSDRYAVHKYSNRKKQQLSPAAVLSHSNTSTSGSSNSGEDTTSTEDPTDSMDDNSRFVVVVKRHGHHVKRCCGRRKVRNRSCTCCNGISIHEEDMEDTTTTTTLVPEEDTSPMTVLHTPVTATTKTTVTNTQSQANTRKRSLPAMHAKRTSPLKKR